MSLRQEPSDPKFSRATIALVLAVSAVALAGCRSSAEVASEYVDTAAYAPMEGGAALAPPSGYEETKIDATTWKVTARGTKVTHPERVFAIARLRAAELGKLNGFATFKVVERSDTLGCTTLPATPNVAYSGTSKTDLTVTYAREPAPRFESVEAYLAANMEHVKATVVPQGEKKAIHIMLREQCDARQRGGA